MKLKQPEMIKEKLAAHGWLTITEMAAGLKTSTNTISRALQGLPVRAGTIRKVAAVLKEEPTTIATFVG
jgi:predicted transcriptional regulator